MEESRKIYWENELENIKHDITSSLNGYLQSLLNKGDKAGDYHKKRYDEATTFFQERVLEYLQERDKE